MSDLSAQEAADRLGVKLDTVYAYVSRGVLRARRQTGSRRSLFDASEVEAVARRGRPRRGSRPPALDLIVATGLTHITGHRILYRGRDVCAMARDCSFEQAAGWLWTGESADDGVPWEPYPMALPDLPHVRDRLRAAVILSSVSEPLRSDLGVAAVAAAARSLIASMVSGVPAPAGHRTAAAPLVLGQDRAPVRSSIAGSLWSRLSRPSRLSRLSLGPDAPGMVCALNAALVLLADHELAPSTLAARIAASVRADPFSVVLAGLGPVSGPLHGGASALAHQMLADAIARGPEPAMASALETHGHLPGFGHPLYPDGDPRARFLLDMIKTASPGAPAVTAAGALTGAASRHSRIEPNIDFALAVLATAARMPVTAGETIFTIARAAGWIAHAIEEYAEAPLRFRARAVVRH